jgi:hypothetical protein
MAAVASNVSIVALVGNGRPCLLTPNASCQYDPAWRNGTLHDIVGAGVRSGPATLAVGPAQGLNSTRRLGLVGGGDYSCERVVVAVAETCRANGFP